MTNHTCDKCGRELDANTLFCPHCGAAVFHGSTGAPTKPSAPPPEPAPTKVPQEESPKRFDYKKLIPLGAVALAVILALILSWDTLAGIFSPGENPQLSTSPSTEQTIPSTSPPQPTENTSPAPTETDPPATTEPVTQPTETEPPETTLPALEGTALPWIQLLNYKQMLSYGNNRFINSATSTVFSHPKEVNLYQLFCIGISPELNNLTDEEFTHFSAEIDYLAYIDVHVLPPDRMSQVLTEHFGITFEETDKRGMDKFQYWEETGNYYWFGTDFTGNYHIEVLAGSTLSDGSIQILYRSSAPRHDADLGIENDLWIMTFTPEGTIFSNLPA